MIGKFWFLIPLALVALISYGPAQQALQDRLAAASAPLPVVAADAAGTTVAPQPAADPGSNPPTRENGPGVVLFDFDGEEPGWYTVDDNVMGGISSSIVSIDESRQTLTFRGSMSLDNNGGFASSRSAWAAYNLGDFDGVVLRVRGDGNIYRFRVRTEPTGPGIAYTALFETEKDQWQEIYLPFAEMVPLYRGFVVNRAGPLQADQIRSFGLMLSDKQDGEFELEVDWINAVAESRREIRLASGPIYQ